MLLGSLSDSDLLALLAESNENAFRELYERYWYRVYKLAVNKTGRKDVSEEMAQQLFEVLWKKRGALKIDNIQAYLHTALKNLVIDHIRKNLREADYLKHLETYFPYPATLNATDMHYQELTHAMHIALNQLPEKTRQVFLMSRFEQLTIPEIAAELNLSDKAIEYHLSRALSFLRKNLREFVPVLLAVFLS